MYRTFSLSLMFLVGMNAAHAADADVHTLQGAACQKVGSTGTLNISSTTGAIYNSSTASLTVVCPVNKNINPFDHDNEIWVVDQSSSANVSCTMYQNILIEGDSMGVDDYLTFSSSGSGSKLQRIEWDGDAFDYDAYHNFSLKCVIPGASSSSSYSYLVAYELEETP